MFRIRKAAGAFAVALGLLLTPACHAWAVVDSAAHDDWRTECFAAYQVDLPMSLKLDERYAGSPLADLNGGNEQLKDVPVASGSEVTPAQFAKLKDDLRDAYADLKKYTLKQAADTDMDQTKREKLALAASIKPYVISIPDAFAWAAGDDDVTAYLYRAGRIYSVQGHTNGYTLPVEPTFEEKLKLFRPRELFEVPSGPGLCVPYAFTGAIYRNRSLEIGLRGSLKGHPDIKLEIFNTEPPMPSCQTCVIHLSAGANRKSTTDGLMEIWKSYMSSRNLSASGTDQGIKKLEFLSNPSFPEVGIGDYRGYSSLIGLARGNNDLDYGYLALAFVGNANVMRVWLIQTSADARRQGIQPLSREQFEQLANRIVRSIRKRK